MTHMAVYLNIAKNRIHLFGSKHKTAQNCVKRYLMSEAVIKVRKSRTGFVGRELRMRSDLRQQSKLNGRLL